jgi:hypothetical protein
MPAPPPPELSLYATRWKPFMAAVGIGGLLVVDVLQYFVWPTPTITTHPENYQEPNKTILFLFVFIVGGLGVLLALYWTFTRRPLLQLTTTSLMYRPFPKPPFTVHWADVVLIEADTRKDSVYPVPFYHITILTLWFNLKSEDDQPLYPVSIDLRPANFSLSATELVQLIRTYHKVRWRPRPKAAKARKQARRAVRGSEQRTHWLMVALRPGSTSQALTT